MDGFPKEDRAFSKRDEARGSGRNSPNVDGSRGKAPVRVLGDFIPQKLNKNVKLCKMFMFSCTKFEEQSLNSILCKHTFK